MVAPSLEFTTVAPGQEQMNCLDFTGKTRCGCFETASQCAWASHDCEESVKELDAVLPKELNENAERLHDRPLLNTFVVHMDIKRTKWQRRAQSGSQDKSKDDSNSNDFPLAPEFGCRMASQKALSGPEWFGVAGMVHNVLTPMMTPTTCTKEQEDTLRECLFYYNRCEYIRKRLTHKLLRTEEQAQCLDSHPLYPPGVYSGVS